MYDYTGRIIEYIENRLNVECRVSIDMCSMNYIVVVNCPYGYRYTTKIPDEKLTKYFVHTMQDVVSDLRFEWQMLLTKA